MVLGTLLIITDPVTDQRWSDACLRLGREEASLVLVIVATEVQLPTQNRPSLVSCMGKLSTPDSQKSSTETSNSLVRGIVSSMRTTSFAIIAVSITLRRCSENSCRCRGGGNCSEKSNAASLLRELLPSRYPRSARLRFKIYTV